MLKNITIQNFRGIKELTVEDFGRVNLLVGGNNSGKTSVLEAVVFVVNTHNLQSPFFITKLIRTMNSRIDEEHLLDGLWRSLFYQFSVQNKITIDTCFFNGVTRSIEMTPLWQTHSDVQDAGKISGLSQQVNAIKGLNYRIINDNKEDSVLEASITSSLTSDKKINLQIEGNQNYQNDTAGHVALIVAPNKGLQLGYEQLQNIFNNPVLEERIKNTLQILIPSLKGLYINGDQTYLDTGFGRINMDFFGDGTRNIFAFIALIASSPNGIVAIDEIDTGLHYSFQKEVWKAIFVAAKENNVQIFATTHSDECIAAMSEAYTEVWKDKEEDEIRLYRIQKSEQGDLRAVTYDADILEMALERNREMR